jgi:hypothetical protein
MRIIQTKKKENARVGNKKAVGINVPGQHVSHRTKEPYTEKHGVFVFSCFAGIWRNENRQVPLRLFDDVSARPQTEKKKSTLCALIPQSVEAPPQTP